MIIEMKKYVNAPNGFYCEGCTACENGIKKEYKNGCFVGDKPYKYCGVTGEFLKEAKNGKHLKTNTCFAEIRKHLQK